jgi:hypothetical protein
LKLGDTLLEIGTTIQCFADGHCVIVAHYK